MKIKLTVSKQVLLLLILSSAITLICSEFVKCFIITTTSQHSQPDRSKIKSGFYRLSMATANKSVNYHINQMSTSKVQFSMSLLWLEEHATMQEPGTLREVLILRGLSPIMLKFNKLSSIILCLKIQDRFARLSCK